MQKGVVITIKFMCSRVGQFMGSIFSIKKKVYDFFLINCWLYVRSKIFWALHLRNYLHNKFSILWTKCNAYLREIGATTETLALLRKPISSRNVIFINIFRGDFSRKRIFVINRFLNDAGRRWQKRPKNLKLFFLVL